MRHTATLITDMERFIDAAVEQFARDHTEPETDFTSVSGKKPIERWTGRRCRSMSSKAAFSKCSSA